MPKTKNLHNRLDVLSKHLDDACEQLEFKGKLRDGHHLSNGELRARYAFLRSDIGGKMASLEAHGHHVGALEQDVMTWVKGLDLDT